MAEDIGAGCGGGRFSPVQFPRKYADAKSYDIESVEERTSSTNYSRYWDKTIITAAQSPGDRFYYEGRCAGRLVTGNL